MPTWLHERVRASGDYLGGSRAWWNRFGSDSFLVPGGAGPGHAGEEFFVSAMVPHAA